MDSGDHASSQSREETPDSDSGYNAQVTVVTNSSTATATTSSSSKPPMPLPQPQHPNSLFLNEIRLRKPPVESSAESSYVNVSGASQQQQQSTPPPPAREQKPAGPQQPSPQSNLSSPGKLLCNGNWVSPRSLFLLSNGIFYVGEINSRRFCVILSTHSGTAIAISRICNDRLFII